MGIQFSFRFFFYLNSTSIKNNTWISANYKLSGYQRFMVRISAYYDSDIHVIRSGYQRIIIWITVYSGPDISVFFSGNQRTMVGISAYYGPLGNACYH